VESGFTLKQRNGTSSVGEILVPLILQQPGACDLPVLEEEEITEVVERLHRRFNERSRKEEAANENLGA
jgi:hypothetical protein